MAMVLGSWGACGLAPAIHLFLEFTHSDQKENEQTMQVLPTVTEASG